MRGYIESLALSLWGKLNRSPDAPAQWLPLEDHCTDVAAVFRRLAALPGPRRALRRAASLDLTDTHLDRLAVFAFLHDIGKCNRGFQAKAYPAATHVAGHVSEISALFGHPTLQAPFCAALQLHRLGEWFKSDDALAAEDDVLRVLLASVSHHGKPVVLTPTEDHRLAKWWHDDGARDPIADIATLVQRALDMFPGADQPAPPIQASAALQHRFAGLVMLADWLGSHAESFFPLTHDGGSRQDFAWAAAGRALVAVGLDVRGARESNKVADFRNLFGFAPTPLQHALFSTGDNALVIAESDTGSGKTEGALAYFYRLFMAGDVDGLYFALPTRVAAREIYQRVLAFARNAFPDAPPPALLAVPGYAQLDGVPASTLLPDTAHLWQEDAAIRRHERAWAAERPKRFLAAPIAVGTIDQALLSVMQVPHAHLRSACLDRSLLVVDEVHASDTYMRGLLRPLLDHHRQAGGRALLLSATLGSAMRNELLTPPGQPVPSEALQSSRAMPYPALTGDDAVPQAFTRAVPSRSKQVTLDPVPHLSDSRKLLQPISEALAAGARVLVVLNTVDRVIRLIQAAERVPELAASLFRCQGVMCPHHGRFARSDREVLDQAVSARLGKGSEPGPVLLIGSQTLEQSLDIDADWLVTDLCPMDVLLQRIGRLHRHDRTRPDGFEQPRCTVLVPEADSLAYLFDRRARVHPEAGLGRVYPDLRVAQLTREAIGTGVTVHIPEDNRALVEAATHPENLDRFRHEPWETHRHELLAIAMAHGQAAQTALIPQAEEFGDLRFGAVPGRLVTRLGLDDRRIAFPESVLSPFGQRLRDITIPGWMVQGSEAAELDGPVTTTSDGLRFHYAGHAFRYTRYGLERDDECQPAG